jgi:hypothetical protein
MRGDEMRGEETGHEPHLVRDGNGAGASGHACVTFACEAAARPQAKPRVATCVTPRVATCVTPRVASCVRLQRGHESHRAWGSHTVCGCCRRLRFEAADGLLTTITSDESVIISGAWGATACSTCAARRTVHARAMHEGCADLGHRGPARKRGVGGVAAKGSKG